MFGMPRKPGVAEPIELAAFVAAAGGTARHELGTRRAAGYGGDGMFTKFVGSIAIAVGVGVAVVRVGRRRGVSIDAN